MERSRSHAIAGTVAAALSITLLAGCSGTSDVASGIGGLFQSIVHDITDPITVAEAREQRRSELMPSVSDDDLVTPGTLTVGLRATGAAPLVIASEDGSYQGIDVDTAYALADQLGLGSVEFVSVRSVAEGVETCDVVMGADADETGCTVVGSYVQSALGVFCAGEPASVPIDASALSGATVGVQSGSVSQASLDELDLGCTDETFSNLNEAFDALSAGTVDYVVCDAYAGAYLATAYDGVGFAGTIDTPATVGVAVASDSSNLIGNVQMALDEIQVNGVAEIGKSRWVGDFPSLTEATVVANLPEPRSDADAEDADAEGAGAEDADAEGTDSEDETGTLIATATAVDGSGESGDTLAP